MCDPDLSALYQPSFSSILIIIRLFMCVLIHITVGFVNYILALMDNNCMKMDGQYHVVLRTQADVR